MARVSFRGAVEVIGVSHYAAAGAHDPRIPDQQDLNKQEMNDLVRFEDEACRLSVDPTQICIVRHDDGAGAMSSLVRGTGITAYLENGGTTSTRTTPKVVR